MQQSTAPSPDDYIRRGYGDQQIGFGKRPAFLVVDFQRANTDPTFPIGGAPMVVKAVETTSSLLVMARERRVPVATCYTAYNGPQDTPHWKIRAMREIYRHGHPCAEIDARILDTEYDFVVCKTGPSLFFQTPVISFLVRQQIDTVIIVGCNTSGCIRATAVDSFQYGFRTSVVEDCVGDIEVGPHETNLRDIGRRYCDIVTSEHVKSYLGGQFEHVD